MRKKQLVGRPKKAAEQKCSIETKICYTSKQDELLQDLLQKTGKKHKADLIKEIVFEKKIVFKKVDQTMQFYFQQLSQLASSIENIYEENWREIDQLKEEASAPEEKAVFEKIQNYLQQLDKLQQKLDQQSSEVYMLWSQKYRKEAV